MNPRTPLIAGAGPVGLSAALFLRHTGLPVRIVERADERTLQSRALAVSPRTLELLEETGVTARMLALGRPIRGARLCQGKEVLAEFSFEGIHERYPFMLALSQSTTERLLEEALQHAGVEVERGTIVTQCRLGHDGVFTALARGDRHELVESRWLLGADGAHSAVRNQFELGFEGSSFAS